MSWPPPAGLFQHDDDRGRPRRAHPEGSRVAQVTGFLTDMTSATAGDRVGGYRFVGAEAFPASECRPTRRPDQISPWRDEFRSPKRSTQ
jgi:hypothetical protein